MSSFNRRLFLKCTAGPLLLAGCGFTPAYAPDGAARNLRGRISVDEPRDANGFALGRQLEHRLGLPADVRYGLSVALDLRENGVALTTDNRTTRIEVIGEATYALRSLETSEVLLSGKVNNFTGYSTTGSTVAQLSAQRDARERLMIILADQITTALIARASDLPA